MTVRQEIAYALGTVTGVSGHLARPAAPTAGAGWPQWVQTRYTNVPDCGPVPDGTDWEVIVMLPALDPLHADALRDMVATALGTIASVETAEPDTIELTSDGNPAPVIRYTLQIHEGN
jgi:hypothetical protein